MKKQNWLYKLISRLWNRNNAIKPKILLFSEYRIVNAMYIREQLSKNNNPFHDPITYEIACYYVDYLFICGIDVTEMLRELQFKCNERYVSYNKNIYDNLTDIMDHITDTDYLFKNYKL